MARSPHRHCNRARSAWCSTRRQAPEIATAIRVNDTRLALGTLAAAWRQRFTLPVIGITGSNGKTTVKEMLAAILRIEAGSDAAVLNTEGNLNNDIGLPLMLLRLRDTHRFAVLEMGMNHAGEIDYLTRLARPDIAVVINALTAHIGFLGSVENIARAKGEIFNGLTEAGIAVFNADDAHAHLWREQNAQRRGHRFWSGGIGQGAWQLRAHRIRFGAYRHVAAWHAGNLHCRFLVSTT